MKKLSIIAYILLFVILITACVQTGSMEHQRYVSDGKLAVACTVFPVYDWITQIIGEENEKIEIIFLGEKKDTHSYQPLIQDVAAVASSDLIIFVGGESDKWIEKPVTEQKLNAVRLFDVSRDALLEEEHSHDDDIDEGGYDEHIWLSLRIAESLVKEICNKLCILEPSGAAEYQKNGEKYCQRLRELDAEYMKAVKNSKEKTVVFADRFPFRYMMEDYGIECVAAFPGCSAEQDADFETIAKLARAVDRLEKETVLVLENSNQTVADAVIKSTEKRTAKAAVMNSCQAVIEKDADYIEIMQKNLKALKAALK